jgi:decaprenyl-phosphate phosphoribosyltransferase
MSLLSSTLQYNLVAWVKLLRPHQYTKNIFIFLPLFFAVRITDVDLLLHAVLSFVLFSLLASAVYILNDLKDIEEDRAHPTKSLRPLASRAVSTSSAKILMFILASISLGSALLIQWELAFILSIYLLINVGYSLGLKHVAILDLFIIATGFLLRIFAGSVSTGVELTMWIILITFLLAVFLGLAKRRDDVLLANGGLKTRKNINGYNLEFVNAAMIIMASVVIVSYIFYTISPEIQQKFQSKFLYLTVFFVIMGIMRYMQITFVENNSGNPTSILLKDRFLQASILAWIVAFVFIIY